MRWVLAVATSAALLGGCATSPNAPHYGPAGSGQGPYATVPVNRLPAPDRPPPDDMVSGQTPPDLDPPYRPMSVSGPPPPSAMAGEVMKGVVRTLAIVGMAALNGRSFSFGGGRVYGQVYSY